MSSYFDLAPPASVLEQYPVGDAFEARFVGMGADELRSLQERRFAEVVQVAWHTPFYRRLWGRAGVEPGDIGGLDDLASLPVFDKSDVLDAVDRHPPFGDLAVRDDGDRPRVLHTTSGTTGSPQPVIWGAWTREVQSALLARLYRWAGVGPTDVVHSVYGHGLINGGHYVREAFVHYTEALFVSAGTGLETRSERQVDLMGRLRPTVLVGFADYLRKLAGQAREAGLEPGRDIPVRLIIGHLPSDERAALESAWGGARAHDWYGVADTGIIAGEGPDRDGLHVWEDAHVVELLDVDTGAAVPEGGRGDLVVTSLMQRDLAPLIRFNTHDVTSFVAGPSPAGLPFRRIVGFRGRSDNMVKLRGINVFPHAVGALLEGRPGLTGEYVCRLVRRADGADHLIVEVEHGGDADAASLTSELSATLGVGIEVLTVPAGATAAVTEVLSRQKPIRLVDERH